MFICPWSIRRPQQSQGAYKQKKVLMVSFLQTLQIIDSLVELHIASIIAQQDWIKVFPPYESCIAEKDILTIRQYTNRFDEQFNIVGKYLKKENIETFVRNTCDVLGKLLQNIHVNSIQFILFISHTPRE